MEGEVEGSWKRGSDYKKKKKFVHRMAARTVCSPFAATAFSSLYLGQDVFQSILHSEYSYFTQHYFPWPELNRLLIPPFV